MEKFLNDFKHFNTEGAEAKKIVAVLDYIENNFNKEDAAIVFTNRAIFVSCFFLISYLMTRGDISDIEIKKFFINFVNNLSEVNKNSSPRMPTEKILKLKDFQTAVLQGADSISSIKKRHQILLEEFVSFDKNVAKIVNYKTEEDYFKELYKEALTRFKGKHAKLNGALIACGCKIKRSNMGDEALPVYIRHDNEHPGHRKYDKKEFSYAIKFLENFENK
ncbi:MAG: hypothetical protein PHP62_02065 [Candidatus Moranbacteria bacterium]|nr:hypothetical protein [Candidatus Moranbacteria bacterium]